MKLSALYGLGQTPTNAEIAAFFAANVNDPATIAAAMIKYDLTVADVQAATNTNYTTAQVTDYFASAGIDSATLPQPPPPPLTSQQIADRDANLFITANVHNPFVVAVAAVDKHYTTVDLARIMNVSVDNVNSYFSSAGIDLLKVKPETVYFAKSGAYAASQIKQWVAPLITSGNYDAVRARFNQEGIDPALLDKIMGYTQGTVAAWLTANPIPKAPFMGDLLAEFERATIAQYGQPLDRPWTIPGSCQPYDADVWAAGQRIIDHYNQLLTDYNAKYGTRYQSKYVTPCDLPVTAYQASLPSEHKASSGFFSGADFLIPLLIGAVFIIGPELLTGFDFAETAVLDTATEIGIDSATVIDTSVETASLVAPEVVTETLPLVIEPVGSEILTETLTVAPELITEPVIEATLTDLPLVSEPVGSEIATLPATATELVTEPVIESTLTPFEQQLINKAESTGIQQILKKALAPSSTAKQVITTPGANPVILRVVTAPVVITTVTDKTPTTRITDNTFNPLDLFTSTKSSDASLQASSDASNLIPIAVLIAVGLLAMRN